MRKQVLSVYYSQLSRYNTPKPIREIEALKAYVRSAVRDLTLRKFLINQLNDAQNKLLFSALMRRIYPKSLVIYDIDAIPVLILGNGKGKRYLGFFELKYKEPWTVKGSEILINWMQFETLYYFSKILDKDLWYIINVGWREFYAFNASHIAPRKEHRGEGISEDNYAVIKKDNVVRMKPYEVVHTFRQLFAEEVV